MAEETYTLYDIPSKGTAGTACWSPNTWKGRAILNIKNVPYKTEWVEYPDIKKVLPKFGLPPTGDERMTYTLPMLLVESKDASGATKQTCIRESDDIMKYINEKHPFPSVDLTDPVNEGFTKSQSSFRAAFVPIVLTAVPNYLPERSAEYFYETREQWFGCKLTEYREKNLDDAWSKMQGFMDETRALLRKNGGPFFLGDKLSGLDIRLAGLLKWAQNTGHREDWEKIQEMGGPEIEKFYKAAAPWLERETY